MRKIKVKVTESTQKNRIGVQETLEHIPNTPGNGGGHGGGPTGARPPRGAPKWFQEFEERNNKRLDRIETTQEEMKKDINDLQSTQKVQGKQIRIIGTKLDTIVEINNLKSK